MPGQALLVIGNDEPLFQVTCREALARAGFTVFTASSAASALSLCLKTGVFDLLVADLALEDGESRGDLLSRVRALCPLIKVLLLSKSTLDQLLAANVLPPEEFRPHQTIFLRQPQPVAVLTGKILGLFETHAGGAVYRAAGAA